MNPTNFREKYGTWALIAGGSQGIGEAFAYELARKGMNLVLIARRKELLESVALKLISYFGIEVRTLSIDLANSDMLDQIKKSTEGIDIGIMVYNAAIIPIGYFLNFELEEQLKVIDINCRGPIILIDYFGKKMKEQKKGGIILVSSMAGFQGTPINAHYAATKAYNTILAEGLWYELKQYNIDVLACIAGSTSTPNYIATEPNNPGILVPKPMQPIKVAKEAIRKLGKKPSFVAGMINKFASFFVRRILSRKQAIKLIGNSTHNMYAYKLESNTK